jgi:hypothetical protein
VNHLTANGTIRIARLVWWYGNDEPSDGRVDRWLGIADSSVSIGSRELCCLVGVDCSFDKAAAKLKKVGQIDVSVERLRVIVEDEGVVMLEARRVGLLKPDWSASQCRPNPSEPLSESNPSCVLVGGDGVMVPVITASEKAKRRAGRRHVRRRGVKNHRRRCRHRGVDQGWKEFKLGMCYSPDKSRVWVFATKGNHEEFGRQLRRESFKVQLEQANRVASITDGAVWLSRQMQRRLPKLDEKILDFYHFAEHVAGASASCWGAETAEAKAWTGHVLHQAKHKGAVAVLEEIIAAKKTLCGRASNAGLSKRAARTALEELEGYVGKRVEMMDYPRFIAEGYDIGSGPTEAKCKTVPHRLKGSGMRWNQPNAEAIAALACTEQSNMLPTYWALQRQQLT